MAGDIVFEMVLDDRGMVAGVKRADIALKDFQRTAQQTAKVVKESEEKYESLGHKFRSMVITFGALRFALMDLNDVFVRLPLSILNTSGELEKMRVLMKGISNEVTELAREAEGTKDFNYVINFSKTAPFDIKSLSDSFVKLKTAGIDPATGAMDALVNSVAKFGGDGEVLKRASIAIQQMAGKGVISMEELRQQLGEAIPTAMRDMADGLGMTMAELAKAVKTGTLQAGPALQAMFVQMRINSLGAAAEFMETWSGATSQLKTEWALTTEMIANSGFAESSKNAVADLVKMLRSPEFREFGMAFGSGLANAVEVIKGLVSGIVKYRDEIGYLIQGMIALKAIDVFGSLGKSANAAYDSISAARKNALAALDKEVVGNRKANFDAHIALQKSLRDEEAAHGQKIALKRKELLAEKQRIAETMAAKRLEFDQYQAINRQMVAEAAALQAKLAAVKGGVNLPGTQGFTSRANVQAQIDEKLAAARAANNAANVVFMAESAEINKSRQARQELVKEIDAHTVAQKATNDQIYKSVVQQKNYVAQSGLATIATKAMTGATTALSAAMSFMGGPIGLLITALGALSFWWMKVANDAEQAGIRQRNAIRGIASEESLKESEAALKDAESSLKTTKIYAEAAARGAKGASILGSAEAVAKAQKKVDDLKTEVEQSRRAVAKTRAADAAQDSARILNDEISAIQTQGKQKILAINAQTDKELRAAGQDQKKRKEVTARSVADRNAELLKIEELSLQKAKGYEKLAALEVSNIVPKNATTEQLKNLTEEQQKKIAIHQNYADQVEQIQARVDQLKAPSGVDFGNGVGNASDAAAKAAAKAAKSNSQSDWKNKATSFKSDLDARKAAVQEGMKQLTSLDADIDKAKIKSEFTDAKLQELINAELDPKIAKSKGKKQKLLLDQKAEAEKLKRELLEGQQSIIDQEEKFKLRLKVKDGLGAFEDDYKDAFARADTSGKTAGMGDNEKKFQSLLNSLEKGGKTAEEVKEQFRALGVSVEEFQGKAQFQDAVADIEKMREASKSLSESEVGLSREVIKERKMARLEEYRQRIQDKIDVMKKEKGLEEQAIKDKKLLDEQIAATAKQISEDAKSPLEKLGDDWKDTAKQMEDASTGWANSTADAILDLVTTGEASFSKLASSIIKDLARIAIQKTMTEAASSYLPMIGQAVIGSFMPGNIGGPGPGYHGNAFANGGIMTSMGSLPLEKYAMGGIAKSPQIALFGEGRMNEAYVPLPDGRTIPVTMTGGQPAGDNVVISINIDNRGNESESSTSDTSSSKEVWNGLAMKIKTVVRQEILDSHRPGGYLYK